MLFLVYLAQYVFCLSGDHVTIVTVLVQIYLLIYLQQPPCTSIPSCTTNL